jgi:hypothetical protein
VSVAIPKGRFFYVRCAKVNAARVREALLKHGRIAASGEGTQTDENSAWMEFHFEKVPHALFEFYRLLDRAGVRSLVQQVELLVRRNDGSVFARQLPLAFG